jgi:MoaA/NifB/PqqE/SkfB family radical SAM enzyme
MKFNLESFCSEAWSQIEIDAEGDFKICCLANNDDDFGMARDENDRVMNILTDDIESAINSKTHKEHRVDLSKNIKPKRCRNCYDSEDTTRGVSDWGDRAKNGLSKRQRVLNRTAPSIPDYITVESASNVTQPDGTIINSKIVNLDLRFGNLCNQKCIMCSPQHSSLWYEDWAAIARGGTETYNRKESVYKKGKYKVYPLVKDEQGRFNMQGVSPWWESDIWWEKFDKISYQVKHIYFTGGEPLIVPAMQECLDRLIRADYAKDITLRYDTNLSAINNKVIEKWKHFKEVLLCVSVDEVGDRYNLIRFPGKFDRLKENIKELQKNNIPIHYISSCIGNASIYSMLRVLELADEFQVDTLFRYLEGPHWLDIRHLPKSAKLEIIATLRPYENKKGWAKWIKSQINLLEKYMDNENQKMIQEFVRVMDILDLQRGTEWRKTLPDSYQLIKDHCNEVKI